MKKILSIILGVFICTQAFAQVSVNAGYLNATIRSGESGYSYKVNGNGFYAGVAYELKLNNYRQISFEPGLNFNLTSYNFGDGIKGTEYFISAPLHFKYAIPVSNEVDFFVSAGPTLLCTVGGKMEANYAGLSYSESSSGGDFDIPIGVEIGALLSNKVKLVAGYDFGLINQSANDYRVTRNFLHIGIGYIF